MKRNLWLATLAVLLVASVAAAFEVDAVIRSVDIQGRKLGVVAGGRMRTVPVAAAVRVLGLDGKPLTGGLTASALKDGATVRLTIDPVDNVPTVTTIRLSAPGAAPRAIPAADTSKLKPLTELGSGEYQGFKGGLYPDGKNERPARHEAAGLALAKSVVPRDAEGKPDPRGKIVLLTIGMSNTNQATNAFIQLANASADKSPAVVIVNGAQGGMTATRIKNPNDGGSGSQYWSVVDDRLRAAGVTRAQVQAVWLKQANAGPREGFPGYARTLQQEMGTIVQLLPSRFPNLKLAYLSSRTYAGYATTPLNPEPYAYESAFSVRWLIEQQLAGDAAFSFEAARGAVRAPWLSWGPYLWANGAAKRADGLFYEKDDFGPDGTHPSFAGQRKVGELLLRFFLTDTTTRGWFKSS